MKNDNFEWFADTGIYKQHPDADDEGASNAATGITPSYSGVINYLNKFGQVLPGNYKDYDPVSELYYAVIRYFKNLGNISSWSDLNTNDANTKEVLLDGFPAITN